MAGSVKKVENAKVAVYTSGVDISQTETKGTVLLKNANEMLNFTRGEEEQLEKVGFLAYPVPLTSASFRQLSRPNPSP